MIFQGKAILVYLEEDNIARAYFRVQPLMTQDGPLGSMTADFPDEGFLRIVPDKNEQHTFKERMRTLGKLCLVDLRFFSTESNKIRTNKNYSPTRGETNQYIVYSDAVRALPDDLMYQVVAESDVSNASTPFVYIRNGANIQGPFRRDNGQPAGETTQLPPDSSEIHAVTVNGQELLFFWPRVEAPAPRAEAAFPRQETPAAEMPAPTADFRPVRPVRPAEPAPAPEPPKAEVLPESAAAEPEKNAFEQIQSLNATVSEKANRLYQPPAVQTMPLPEQPVRPLTGTKLYQVPPRPIPRRAHNPLMEAVESQRYAARMDGRLESRYEAPGATLPQNTELRDVNNPVDALKRLLQTMSLSPETLRQAVDVVQAQPGMRAMLSRGLAQQTNDLTLAAIQSQLQELEAERLMTLMQLDDVKKNLAAAHEEALGKLNMAEQKKLDQLHIAQQNAQNALDELNKAIAPLENKRQELTEKIQEMQGALESKPHFLCPPVGGDVSKAELIDRVEQSLKATGFQVEPGDAQAMLTALALTDKEDAWLEFRSATCDDAWQGCQTFAAALGTSAVEFKKYWQAVIVPGGNAPLFVNSSSVRHALVINFGIDVLGHSAALDSDDWVSPYACVPLYPNAEALPQALPAFPAVSLDCVRKEMLADSPLSDETKAVILSLRKALSDLDHPLSLRAVDLMSRFIAATQKELKGGVAEAIDRAACLYLTQHLLDFGVELAPIKPLLAAMPRTMKALKL